MHFVGDLAAGARAGDPPAWLDRLDSDRPVVHVTAGTLGRDRTSRFCYLAQGEKRDELFHDGESF